MSDPARPVPPPGAGGARRFAGSVAMVAGGASGIGRATAERIVAEGGSVVIGDIDDAALATVTGALGDAAVAVHCDVTDDDGSASVAAAAIERFGRLDVAVASVGTASLVRVVDHPLALWRQIVDVNLTGTFLTVQAAARAMTGPGSIVIVSSLNGVQPAVGMSAYCSTKAALIALSDVSALELGPRGIRVNAVAPGLVNTPLASAQFATPGGVDAYTDNTALGQFSEPEDIAAGIAYLASDDARTVTGTTLFVDGGAQHFRYPDLEALFAGPPRGASA